jgi:4-hydroxy-2-oxoheptanedioate aldolase
MSKMQIQEGWRKGRPARNAWQHLPGTYLSELLAASGVDVVTLDLQHGMIDLPAARDSILAIEARGAAPFVRLPRVDESLIGSLLDAGVAGLICPTVESRAQAEALVAAAYYPPLGNRSCGPNRALLSFGEDYVNTARDRIVIFAMIETVAGLEAVDEIARIKNLSGLFIGPGDLGISMGLGPGQDRTETEIKDAIKQVRKAARQHDKRLGIHASTPEYAARMAEQGFDLVTVFSDAELVGNGAAQALQRFAELAPQKRLVRQD